MTNEVQKEETPNPYNKNNYPGFDAHNLHMGQFTSIDDIHKSTDLDSLARRHWENKHCSHAMQSLDLNNPKSQHFGIYFDMSLRWN